mmetsp:Transcript_26632/g.39392  ORF Transcript_26632/g.39392 Transcript_26632/m.39392 type:complete len:155 (-) Transcript_26632:119-583(-)
MNVVKHVCHMNVLIFFNNCLHNTLGRFSDTGNETPVEMQLEEVDMENEDMDMLEWLVRKIIPIPKEYYWETGNDDLPLRTKAWHQVVGSLSATIKLIDRMGKPIVDASGLKNSRFEYVRETMTEAQMQESIEKAQERKLEVQNSQRRHISEEEI